MTNLKALIIDDEIDICVLLSGILKQIGINTSFAVSLNEGRKFLDEKAYEILFLDNNLPDGSGLEHLPRINQEYPGMKIIMISAYDGDKERESAKQNGAVDFIGKPLSGRAIRSSLQNHFTSLNL